MNFETFLLFSKINAGVYKKGRENSFLSERVTFDIAEGISLYSGCVVKINRHFFIDMT